MAYALQENSLGLRIPGSETEAIGTVLSVRRLTLARCLSHAGRYAATPELVRGKGFIQRRDKRVQLDRLRQQRSALAFQQTRATQRFRLRKVGARDHGQRRSSEGAILNDLEQPQALRMR